MSTRMCSQKLIYNSTLIFDFTTPDLDGRSLFVVTIILYRQTRWILDRILMQFEQVHSVYELRLPYIIHHA